MSIVKDSNGMYVHILQNQCNNILINRKQIKNKRAKKTKSEIKEFQPISCTRPLPTFIPKAELASGKF